MLLLTPGGVPRFRTYGGEQGCLHCVVQGGVRRAVLIMVIVVVTVITLVWPGAINAMFGQSYSVEASWGVSRAFFEWTTLGSLIVMVLLGLAFWQLGERNRRAGLVGIELPPELLAESGEHG